MSCVFGGDGFGGFAEMTLKVDLSTESKMYGFPLENVGFHVSLGVMGLAAPQKRHLKLTSVWKANCMDFPKK